VMFIMGIVSNITNINLNQLTVNSPFENTTAKQVLEHLGEKGQNNNLHRFYSNTSKGYLESPWAFPFNRVAFPADRRF